MKRSLVTFSSDSIADVQAILDTAIPSVTDGYGTWETISRPRKKGLTQYTGRNPFQMTVPILFDGYKGTDGQEVAISRLSRMALPPSDGAEPPIVHISGAGIPRPGPTDWVIAALAWGQNVIRESIGGVMVRTRQDCVVTLLEHVDPTKEAFKSLPGLSVTTGTKKVPARVTVKAGQTIQQISMAVYGTASKWQKIATANNLRDPKRLKAGTVLRIP